MSRSVGAIQPYHPDVGALQSAPPSAKPTVPVLYTRHELANGLVCALDLGQSSGTSVPDLSGNGNNGTATGASWGYDPDIGFYWKNNASSDYINIPNSVSIQAISGAFTVSVLFRGGGRGASYACICGGLASSRGFLVQAYQTTFSVGARLDLSTGVDNSLRQTDETKTVGRRGAWNKILVAYDGASLSVYEQGKLLVTTPLTGSMETTSALQVGKASGVSSYDPSLKIADFRIWNRALSADEIAREAEDPWGLYGVVLGDTSQARRGTGMFNPFSASGRRLMG